MIVGHNRQVVYRKAFGWRSLEPRREAMTLDTVFDLASLTKPVATAMSVMRLVQEGKVRLNDPVANYLPEFGRNGKAEITVRQLLTHFSGLPPDLDLTSPWQGKDAAFRLAMDTVPLYPPGSRFLYSDVNYLVLGFLVERACALPLDRYAEANIFAPLGMTATRFQPPPQWQARTAPTERVNVDGVLLRGTVHDPTARRMGGVAGHACLFSTADDLARFAQALLDNDGRVLNPLTLEKMTTPQQPPNATVVRGLGWDIDSPLSSSRGELLPVGSFGHTGFTGTSLWIDPVTNTYIIVLTNSVASNGNSVVSLRARTANATAAALGLNVTEAQNLRWARITGYNEASPAAQRLPFRNGQVKTGIDVLEQRNFDLLRRAGSRNNRVGLVTNQTGLDRAGRRTIDVLAHAPGIELAAIFSPEHGAAGQLDSAEVANTRDEPTGIPVYSVYGASDAQRRPPLEILRTLDEIVFDIQDAGVRFYTYETTLGYFLEAAAQAAIPIYVLDRPNPITGSYVQGPLSDPALCPTDNCRFVNYHPLPVRHGMTIGELARFFNGERQLHARLTVVSMEGWWRGDWFDSTGVGWVNPSPNLRSLTETTLYPAVGLIEGTNVSVGRGADTPFELVGAPWIHAQELAAYLNQRAIAGVRFLPVSFTPSSGPFAQERCQGVNLIVIDRTTLDAPELGLELASALNHLYGGEYKLDRIMDLLSNRTVFNSLAAQWDPRRIEEDYRDESLRFEKIRQKYLIY